VASRRNAWHDHTHGNIRRFTKKEKADMKNPITVAATILIAACVAIPVAFAVERADDDDDDDDDGIALVSALEHATLPLEQALAASASAGTPISAKYEIEQGKIQLSVYTMKDDTFTEVIVDHASGTIGKVVPITEGDDLRAAQMQRETMVKARRSLESATADAVRANNGYRAVSAMPSLKDGYPVAEVVLVRGSERKFVSQRLQGDD
jgi:hypothetical protein